MEPRMGHPRKERARSEVRVMLPRERMEKWGLRTVDRAATRE
jgi:hypothetical protein